MSEKYVHFEVDGKEGFGVLEKNKVVLEDKEFHLDEVDVLPPVEPSKVICVGLNYRSHIKEMDDFIPESPVFFYKPPSAVIGDEDQIVLPSEPNRVDYEAEMAVVVGEECRNVSKEESGRYILGYTCLNDVTARDIQDKEEQWVISKGYDSFCPIGPVISTEIPNNAEVKGYVNGVERQSSNIGELIFDERELVSRLSKAMTLKRGDVVSTGTPSGVGKLERGDEVKIEVEGVGKLKNQVE